MGAGPLPSPKRTLYQTVTLRCLQVVTVLLPAIYWVLCVSGPGLSISRVGFCTSLMWYCLQQVWGWGEESTFTSEEWKSLCSQPAPVGFHRAKSAPFSREAWNPYFPMKSACFSVLATTAILRSDSLWFRLEVCFKLWALHFMEALTNFETTRKENVLHTPLTEELP